MCRLWMCNTKPNKKSYLQSPNLGMSRRGGTTNEKKVY